MRLFIVLALVVIYAEAHSGRFWMPKVFVIKSKKRIFRNYNLGYTKGYSKYGKSKYMSNSDSLNYVEQRRLQVPSKSGLTDYTSQSDYLEIVKPVTTSSDISNSYANQPIGIGSMMIQDYGTQTSAQAFSKDTLGESSTIPIKEQRGLPWIDITGIGSTSNAEILQEGDGTGIVGRSNEVPISKEPEGLTDVIGTSTEKGPQIDPGGRTDRAAIFITPDGIANSAVIGSIHGSGDYVGQMVDSGHTPDRSYAGYAIHRHRGPDYTNSYAFKPATKKSYIIRRYYKVPNKFHNLVM